MFYIFFYNLFLEHEDWFSTNYADDTTPYVAANNTAKVIENLTSITKELFTRFANNQMKANPDKCHLFVSAQEEANIHIVNTTIKCSKSTKILGIIPDNKLKFDKHIEIIYQKTSRKLNLLAGLTNLMELGRC